MIDQRLIDAVRAEVFGTDEAMRVVDALPNICRQNPGEGAYVAFVLLATRGEQAEDCTKRMAALTAVVERYEEAAEDAKNQRYEER